MTDIFQFADELGPTKAIHVYEPTVGLKAVLVVDDVTAGLSSLPTSTKSNPRL